MSDRPTVLARLSSRGDIALVALVVAIIALMVLPMPPALLDTLIALNIAASVGLLMLAIYVPSASGLSTFPSLLLFTTLLRLSLNIASTKLILLHAHAGHIIETFGQLVVGGNALVGGVVFVIIAVVQFIVIAKGSERVAEVGARFTLDGMPGKQMSIDADLRAGLIDKEEAKRRRTALEEESQWHGAMDGAMKFVKGDAIGGLIIALVNILAGIAVGAGMKGMSIGDAVSRYTLLTVGDGMVSQIPSLFVSVAAGILITRVASTGDDSGNLGARITGQVLAHPVSLAMTAVVMLSFVVVPGFPKLQFALLAAAVGVLSFVSMRSRGVDRTPERTRVPAMRGDAEREVPHFIDQEIGRVAAPVLVRLSPSLKGVLDPVRFGVALNRVRRELYESLGLPFPGVRLRYDDGLATRGYAIVVQDVLASRHELNMADPSQERVAGNEQVQPEDAIADHIKSAVTKRADMFLGIQEVQRMIEECSRYMPDLAQELLKTTPLQRVADVMKRLVVEGIPLRNVRDIFESLVVWVAKEKDPQMLAERVRVDIGAMTVARIAKERSELPVIVLSHETEEAVRASIQATLGGSYLALGPEKTEVLLAQFRTLVQRARESDHDVLAVCSMDIRRHIKRALEGTIDDLTVLSYEELGSHTRLSVAGQIEL